MPALIAEGGDPRNLARLASRLGRANAAVEVLADGAERYLALRDRRSAEAGLEIHASASRSFDAAAFAAMPEEIRLRLLLRAINQFGHEGPAELGKVEALLSALDRTGESITGRSNPIRPKQGGVRVKQTLAGAMISLVDGRIRIEPAPIRRRPR